MEKKLKQLEQGADAGELDHGVGRRPQNGLRSEAFGLASVASMSACLDFTRETY